MKDCLQKRIRTGRVRCGNHLGCQKWVDPGLSKGNRLRGDGRFASVENKPDLNRKIYRVHRHCALLGTLLCGAIR